MIDDIDRAQEREQLDRELALSAQRKRIEASFGPRDADANEWCCGCGNRIEPARIAALGPLISRCAACARQLEAERGAAP